MIRTLFNSFIIVTFFFTSLGPTALQAQEVSLPHPGAMVHLSPAASPIMMQGVRVHPENPFQFDFVMDTGDSAIDVQSPQFNEEATRLIKYFLASLTIPENEVWVNLSPYEKNRIIPDSLGKTFMGREMLAQDYLLKQLTASLIYPEKDLGKKFWSEIYKKVYEKYGTNNIPVETFNKVWIVPDQAEVYEEGNAAYVSKSHLKVMLETDYLSSTKNSTASKGSTSSQEELAKQIIREVMLPVLEKEINTGENFASVRQIYNAMILAVWFKVKLEKSILGQVYVNKNKVQGTDTKDKNFQQKIYAQYLQAFKTGVYNYIKEEKDPLTSEIISRKYFSGGLLGVDRASLSIKTDALTRASLPGISGQRVAVSSALQGMLPKKGNADSAMGGESNSYGDQQKELTDIKESIAQKLGLDISSPNVDRLAHVELVRREFLRSHEEKKESLKDLFATIYSQGPPKVAEVHFSYPPPSWSGVDIVLAEHVSWLTRQQFPTTIISSTPGHVDDVNRRFVYVPQLTSLSGNDPIVSAVHHNRVIPEFHTLEEKIYVQLKDEITQQDIIIIHNIMTIRNNLSATAALEKLIKENPQKRFIIYVHNTEDSRHRSYPLSLLNPDLPVANVTYVTVSEAYREEVAGKYGLPLNHFSILNPGVHPYSPLNMSPATVENFRKHGLLDNDMPSLAYITRVDRNKDIGRVFHIFDALLKRTPVRLIIAAAGINSYDELIREVENKIGWPMADFIRSKREAVEKNIIFLNPALVDEYKAHRQYIFDIMAISNFFIYPTFMETFGMGVVEAAVTGTGIIASNVPAHNESVGRQAVLFDDHEDVYRTVDRIIERVSQYREGQSSRDDFQRSILERYDWDRLMESQLAPLLAVALCDKVFSRDSEGIYSRIQFGDILLENGYSEVARAVYESVVAPFNLSDTRPRIKLAGTLRQEGHLNAALALYESVLQIDRNNTQARIEIAGISLDTGDRKRAREMFIEVLNIDPNNLHAHVGASYLNSFDPDMRETISEGGAVNHVVRYVEQRVAAHISIHDRPSKTPEIIIAMPAKDSENAFYLRASSREGEFRWNAGDVSPIVTKDGHRGVNVEFRTDARSVDFNLSDPSNFMLSNVINLRMFRFYGQNIPQQERELMAHIRGLPAAQRSELEQLIGVSLSEIIIPRIRIRSQPDGSHTIEITKTTFDGRHHYRCFIQVPADFTIENNNSSIRIKGSRPVELLVQATTDFEPLTPLAMSEIFNEDALKEIETNPRFAQIAQNFDLLFYQEKLMAGSWPYLTYYGRDTLIGARLMWTALSLKAKEIIVRSVLDRIGGSEAGADQDGLVAVNDENSQERLFYLSVTKKFSESKDQKPDVSAMFKEVLKNQKRVTFLYNVLDNTFLMSGVERLLFNDLNDDQLRAFLNSKNGRSETNVQTILRNWNKILELTDTYTQGVNALRAESPSTDVGALSSLSGFSPLANLLVRKIPNATDANWRDSYYGNGWGEYVADINGSLAPISIENIASMIQKLTELRIDVNKLAEQNGFRKLQDYLARNGKGLKEAQVAWSTAVEHFKTHLTKDQVRSKLKEFFTRYAISPEQKQTLLQTVISKEGETRVTVQEFLAGTTPAWLEAGIPFTTIALGKRIMHSDETYTLLDKDLDSKELNRILDELFAPYPIGLWNDDVGLFIANAIFSDDISDHREFERPDAYHGQNVVWSKPMRELSWGLIRQMRYAKEQGRAEDVERLEKMLVKVVQVGEKVGGLGLSEVWTWRPEGDKGHMKAAAFHQGGGQPSGNPQLWGVSSDISTPEYIEALGKLGISPSTYDKAMFSKVRNVALAPGGIDLNIRPILKIKRYGDETTVSFSSIQAAEKGIEGFTPVILHIELMNTPFLNTN